MDEDDEREAGGVGLGRTLALSDGIFAIAMTLLAFQVQPPSGLANNGQHLAPALAKLGTSYFVFVLSFAVIGVLWLAHHRLFSHIERADEALMSLNLLFLMTVAALPFPSAVMGRYGSQRTAVVLYASSMAVAGTLLTLLTLLAKRRHLMSPDTTPEGIRQGLWRSGTMVIVFLLSIPVAFVSPSLAPFSWILTMPLRLLTGRRKSRTKA